MPLKLLFIEDQPDSVEPVIIRMEKTKGGVFKCEVKNFNEAEEAINTFSPDIVILDLLVGSPAESEVIGDKTFNFLWDKRFCPIVIYSAAPDRFNDDRKNHPFVKSVQKGKDSLAELEAIISELQPHVEVLREAEEDIKKLSAFALRDVAPFVFDVFTDAYQRREVILRCGRRYLAALMDDLSRHGQELESWEQYIIPPISECPQLGDVMIKKDADTSVPENFYVVLSPSCDLVKTDDRNPKVENVLVAKCCPIKDGLNSVGLKDISADKMIERVLSQGHFQSIIPFPSLEGYIPHFAADLRKLALIPFEEIGDRYLRIASIDSPFRELVSWAYMQIACRPGLPDRDLDSWAKDINKQIKNNG
jgi:hypothetical protein